eukprot:TRINITY_DN3913_c0_g1_i1.p1 TRINITY_DN3913_c0_g1~~TRINITY_DN3913_c0_g1_i1.p1  ORF type:complete len:1383 (+),score=435.91 TRINITY_DN3913_c0_g1_i1:87-4151(+)
MGDGDGARRGSGRRVLPLGAEAAAHPAAAAPDSGSTEHPSAAEARPVADDGCLSTMLLWWIMPVLRAAYSGGLSAADMPLLPPLLRADAVNGRAIELWREQLRKPDPSLVPVFARLISWELKKCTAASVVHGLCVPVARPLLLRWFILEAKGDGEYAHVALALLVAEALLEGFTFVAARHYGGDRIGAIWMQATTALLQDKGMRMASSESNEAALVGGDVMRQYEWLKFISQIIMSWVIFIAGTVVIIWTLGRAGLVGLGVMVMILLINLWLGTKSKQAEGQMLVYGDRRLGLMRRIIEGARAIKFCAWEEDFLERIQSERARECVKLQRFKALFYANVEVGRASPFVCTAASFVVLALVTGDEMRSEDVFSVLSVFQGLRMPLILIPISFTLLSSLRVSMQRLEAFLTLPEHSAHPQPSEAGTAVRMAAATFAWPHSDPDKAQGQLAAALAGLTFSIRRGERVAVVGSVGAGKSSLLAALLHIVQLREGTAEVRSAPGDTGYVPQRAWIVNGTVRANVTMGRPWDRRRFDAAVDAACFRADIAILSGGELCEIGERGITLSGGQQQRLAIARALYGAPQLLLLDDPLAAVDGAVANRIFEGAVAADPMARLGEAADGGAAQPRTLVMALNQLHLLPRFDRVLFVRDGTLAADGSFRELAADSAGPFAEWCRGYVAQGSATPVDDTAPLPELLARASAAPQEEIDAAADLELRVDEERETTLPTGIPPSGATLVQAERKAQGGFKSGVFVAYLKGMGCKWSTLSFGGCLVGYAVIGVTDRFLAHWTGEAESAQDAGESFDHRPYAAIYAGGTLLFLTLIYLNGYCFTKASARASREVHNDCICHVMRAPVAYFDSTPSGRLMSRFSSDVSTVDQQLANMTESASAFACTTLMLTVVVISVVPLVGAVVAAALVLYYFEINTVDRANRDTKRIAIGANAPVQSKLAETASADGRAVVRCLGLVEKYRADLRAISDECCVAHFTSSTVINAASLHGYCIATLVSLTASLLLLHEYNGTNANRGLALTYVFLIPFFLQFTSQLFVMFTMALTALERLLQCAGEEVPQEPPWNLPGDAALAARGWPQQGSISFRAVSLRYRPGLPLALCDVSFDIPGGQRVGIVGRTGAGKSSLFVLLFRLVDPASGVVLVDGEDVSQMGLQTLRRRMAIIPQEPLLLDSTVRVNLDPFSQHSDEAVRAALDSVGATGIDLDTNVVQGAAAMSCGERQLLSIARVMLRAEVRVVVLDEPTSNIDMATDDRIQSAVRSAFRGKTVLTIAHRLNTVIDSDAVIVMAKGAVREQGTPAELLQRQPPGALAEMVDALGAEEARRLRRRAAKAAQSAPQDAAAAQQSDATACP